jgi:hypothetical protein
MTTKSEIHSCGPYCDRPGCRKQREASAAAPGVPLQAIAKGSTFARVFDALAEAIEKHDAKKALAASPSAPAAAEPSEQFCDGHCTWLDHHPDCKRATGTPVGEASHVERDTLSPQQVALLRLIAPQCNGYAGREGAPRTFASLAERGLIERGGVFGRYVITEKGIAALASQPAGEPKEVRMPEDCGYPLCGCTVHVPTWQGCAAAPVDGGA